MMDICESFGKTYGMKYNPTKTVVMCMTDRKEATLPNVKLCGESLTWVDKVKHRGNIIRADLKENDEMTKKRGDLISRVNNISAMFPKAHDRTIKELFNSKCAHLYGCETWDQSDPSICRVYTAWNRGVRRLFNLPYTTHTRFLQAFTCTPHAKEQVFIRFYKMVRTMMKSYNHRMSFLARYMSQDARSITGKNLRIIAMHYNIDISDIKSDKKHVCLQNGLTEHDKRTVAMIMEMREVLNGDSVLQGFNNEEVTDILHSLCCD